MSHKDSFEYRREQARLKAVAALDERIRNTPYPPPPPPPKPRYVKQKAFRVLLDKQVVHRKTPRTLRQEIRDAALAAKAQRKAHKEHELKAFKELQVLKTLDLGTAYSRLRDRVLTGALTVEEAARAFALVRSHANAKVWGMKSSTG